MKNNIVKNIFIVILFLSLFTLLNWNSFNAPFERDEGEYAYSAWLLRTGDIPYKDSFLQKPPMIIYTYMIGQFINPWALWPPRMIASIFILITSFLIYLIAKKEWGSFAGIFSTFIFLPLVGFPPITPFAANTEKFMILPMTLVLFLFIYFKDSIKKWPFVLSGVLSSVAIFYKPICLPVLAFIVLFWIFEIYKKNNKDIKTALRAFLYFLIPAIMVGLFFLIPFLGMLPFLIEEVFIFNFSYLGAFSSPFENLFSYILKFLKYWWILIPLFFGLFIKKPKDFYYFIILLLISLFTIFSTPIGHYYVMIMPILALIFGSLFSSVVLRFEHKNKIIFSLVTIPIILYSMIFPFKEQLYLSHAKLSEWVYGTVNPFVDALEIGKKVKEITKEGDSIFVAGSEPEIYYYSQRKTNTRFNITYPLNLPTSFREKYQTELVSDISSANPSLIVVSNRAHSGLWDEDSPTIFIDYLNKLLLENYNIIGGYTYDDKGQGSWKDFTDLRQSMSSSLVIWVKNDK
jgi:hypothetical protein